MNKSIEGRESFFRYMITSGLATGVDFFILILLTELFGVWYFLSATIGAVSGGLVGFFLGRNWAFRRADQKIKTQAIKYSYVWVGSILLNLGLLYAMVEWIGLQYVISKVVVAIVVGLGYNFTLQKYFIFSSKEWIVSKDDI